MIYSDLTAATADAEIARQQAFPLPGGKKLEWKLYGHDRPRDLEVRLRAAGFSREAPETVVILDLRWELPECPPPADITIRQVRDGAGLADLARVGLMAFGVDYSAMNDEFLARVEHGTARFYVAYCGAEPVGAARLETPPSSQFAGLYGGGTVPEHRRRGIYRSLVDVRAHAAKKKGYRFLTVDAADTSLPILLRLGFRVLTPVCAWSWRPT